MIITGPDILPALLFGTAQAKTSLFIMTYTVSGPRPKAAPAYRQFFETLATLAARGLDCRLLSPAPALGGDAPHQQQTHAHLQRAGWQIRRYPPGHTMHAKLFLIDSRRAFIGSANLSESGLSSNVEILTHHDTREDAGTLRAFFLDHWTKAQCRP